MADYLTETILRLHEAMEPTRRMVEKLQADRERNEAWVRQATEASTQARRMVMGAAEQTIEMRKRFAESIGRPLADIAEGFKRMQENMRLLEAEERELMTHLAPLGWLLSPTLTTDAARILLGVVNEQGVDEAERMLIATFTPALCRDILMTCCEFEGYEPWRERFVEALDAHERGEYGLAIPIWLMAIDGIAHQELEIYSVYSEVKKTGKKASAPKKLRGHRAPTAHSDALVEILRLIGEDTRDAEAGALRRNLILHGRDPNYASERSSIQGIVLLESMHRYLAFPSPILDSIDREQSLPAGTPDHQ